MGFLDWLFGQPQQRIPTVPSILPDIVKDEIRNGRLPHINADKLFLKRGEICHYADQALLMVEKKKKIVHSRNHGTSAPGLFKGNRHHWGGSTSHVEERIETEEHKGILYITNKRIIFTSNNIGFDKQYRYLSSVKPYSNALELQYGSTIYSLFVPDGATAYAVIKMLQQELGYESKKSVNALKRMSKEYPKIWKKIICYMLRCQKTFFIARKGGVTFGGDEPLLQGNEIAEFTRLVNKEFSICLET